MSTSTQPCQKFTTYQKNLQSTIFFESKKLTIHVHGGIDGRVSNGVPGIAAVHSAIIQRGHRQNQRPISEQFDAAVLDVLIIELP